MFIEFNSIREFTVTVGSDKSEKAHCLVNGVCYLDGLPDSKFLNHSRQFVAAPSASW